MQIGPWNRLKKQSLIVIAFIFTTFSTFIFSASFFLGDKQVSSMLSESIKECGDYQLLFKTENFPLQYERVIPSKFQIRGFYGSRVIVSREVIVLPEGIRIPRFDKLANIKENYLIDRTYLPSSIECIGNKLVVNYWSGGNCPQCGATVEFEVLENTLVVVNKAKFNTLKD